MVALHSNETKENGALYHVYNKCAMAMICQYLKDTMPYAKDVLITAPDGTLITMPFAVQTLEQIIELM